MTAQGHAKLLERVESAVGDERKCVGQFTREEFQILTGKEFVSQYADVIEARNRDDMHQDCVHRLEQAVLAGKLYETDVYAETAITADGIGVYLYPSPDTGYVVWIGDGGTVELPKFVDECLDVFGREH